MGGHKGSQIDRIMEKAEHELPDWQVTSYPFHRKQILTMEEFKLYLYKYDKNEAKAI